MLGDIVTTSISIRISMILLYLAASRAGFLWILMIDSEAADEKKLRSGMDMRI